MGVMSIAACLAHWAATKADQQAVSDPSRCLTWHSLELTTNRRARAYQNLGVGLGDYVVIALPNGVEFFEAALAAWKLGATPLPLSYRMPPEERGPLLELVQPRLIVGAKQQGFASLPAGMELDPALSDAPLEDRVAPYWKALASGGSTGRPKIIVSRDQGAFDPDESVFRIDGGGAHLVAGPLYHNAAFLFAARSLFAGCRIAILPRFDPQEALAAIERERVTYTVMVPTMMQRIAKLPEAVRNSYDIVSLRTLLHTGAPCASWLRQAWIDWIGGNALLEIFGVTEASGIAWITGSEWLEHPGSSGRPMPGFSVRIADENGTALPVGEIGDIYWMPPQGTGSTYFYLGATPHRDTRGWEWFGDMGHVDAEGYIYLADRRTDLIIAGGANIYPAEVEAVIDGFPGVRSSAVIGLPDEDFGARVHAIVDAPAGLDEPMLREHLTRHLTSYKLPRSIEIVTTPIRDETGKVRRGRLRAERLEPNIFRNVVG